jgi:phosphoglycolate phosphatase-like HAD superfamily hydrolase
LGAGRRRAGKAGSAYDRLVVLVDLDGTLVDSEELNHKAFVQIFREFHLEDKMAIVMEGLATGRDFTGIMGDIGLDEETRQLMAKRMDEIVGSANLHAMPHAAEAIRALDKRGVKFSIATLNLAKRAAQILKHNKLDPLFDKELIVGSDSLPWEKPNPKVVFEVLRRSGRSEAMIIGNHPRDVMLAKNCDIPVIYLKQAVPDSATLAASHESAKLFEARIKDLEQRYDYGKIHWAASWAEVPGIVEKVLAG